MLVNKVRPGFDWGTSIKILNGFKLGCIQLSKLCGTFFSSFQGFLSFELFELIMFARFVDVGFFKFVKHDQLFRVESLELDDNFSILLVDGLVVRDCYVDTHTIKLSFLLFQESKQIFEFCSLFLCCKLCN